MHPKIAARRRRLTLDKLDIVAARIEQLAQSMVATEVSHCGAAASMMVKKYRELSRSLVSGDINEIEASLRLRSLRACVKELAEMVSSAEARPNYVERSKRLRGSSLSPGLRGRISTRLARGFDQVNRQAYLVNELRRSGGDCALAQSVLAEMKKSFLLMSQNSALIDTVHDNCLKAAGRNR